MDYLELSDDDEFIAYFDVQNISIDHSLSSKEIENYKDLIFSPNGLRQIYFKDKCDLKTILLMKDLLTISDYIDDYKVEKYILIDLSEKDYNTIINQSYENPLTWKIPYEKEDDNISLADIPKIRLIESFIKSQKVELSKIEQVMKVYDTIKLFEFERNAECNYSKIIGDKKANAKGMNKLFSFILHKFGYNTFVGKIKSFDEDSYVTLVEIKDKKYNLDGIYLFEPSMDNLSKEKYHNEDVRRMNYNFFGLNLTTFNRLKYKDRLQGILGILSIDDILYAEEKLEVYNIKDINKEKNKLLDAFKIDFSNIYKKIKDTIQIDINTIIKINDELYKSKQEKYNEFLIKNYNARKDDLFEKNTDEELKELVESIKK